MTAPSDPRRLFPSFFDPTDMVMCCPADTPIMKVAAVAAQHAMRFPLVVDPDATLGEHVAAIDYAPQSARFGSYGDNILGMNWVLRSGTCVRIGERVIKSTTGYDLLRFLLHSDGRYGRAADYVLRLRPRGAEVAHASLRGESAAVNSARAALLHSPWVHSLDVVNLVVAAAGALALEIAVECAQGESDVFDAFLGQLSRSHGTEFNFRVVPTGDAQAPGSASPPRLPRLSVKTTVDAAPEIARELVAEHGGDAVVLCVNGVIHYHPRPDAALSASALAKLSSRCTTDGGHLFGPAAGAPAADQQEIAWAHELETAWSHL